MELLDTESRLKIVAIGRGLSTSSRSGLWHIRDHVHVVYPPVSGSRSAELRVRVLVPPGALLCFFHEWLLSFELDTLTRLSAGLLTICKAPARRPRWSVRCIRVATGCSRILTPGERPVLERLRPCTAPRQCLLERAILCETCLSQCLEARRVVE